MPALHIETDPPIEPPPVLVGDSSQLVYFLSFAFAARYGAQHRLTKAAQLLKGGEHKIALKPLLTFADRKAEVEADRQELQRIWQDAAPLAQCCRAVVAALESDPAIQECVADFPHILPLLKGLAGVSQRVAEAGAKIRLTFSLE
jgi:hypothetical protein